MKAKTQVKAGGIPLNHNQTLVRASGQAAGLKVKTRVQAGGLPFNHNQTLVRAKAR